MNISSKELRRIAQVCMLDFTDEEFEFLKSSIETTIKESSALFCCNDCFNADYTTSATPDCDELLDIAKKSFSYCVSTDNDTH